MYALNSALDFRLFRRRIRVLRAWRLGAVGGCIGALAAIVMAALDLFNVRFIDAYMLAIPVAAGIAAGLVWAVVEKVPDAAIARSIDKREDTDDRLTSAVEIPAEDSPMAWALHNDAVRQASELKPSAIYPIRTGRWQGGMVILMLVAALIFMIGNSPWFKSEQAQREQAQLQHAGIEIERVTKPVLDNAKREDATAAEKDLAHRLIRFTDELKKGRISKQDALLKANQLAELAQKLENQRANEMSNTIQSAQSAADQLQKMAQDAQAEKSDAAKLAEQASALQKKIEDLQKQLAAASSGSQKMSASQKAALQQQLAAAQSQMAGIQLSQQAQEMMQKLASMPEFQQAQKILQQMAQNAQSQQSGQGGTMTQQQLKDAAKQLEELAKKMAAGGDKQMKELAKQMLAAAKAAKQGGKNSGVGEGLMSAFGLGTNPGGLNPMGGNMPGPMGSMASKTGGDSSHPWHGRGAPSKDKWTGAHGSLNSSDKSSLLNVPFKDRMLTSQIGPNGPETYTEVRGPSQPGGKTSIPYQQVLPKYEKSAEAALSKGDIPPSMRGKVRDYFESLHK